VGNPTLTRITSREISGSAGTRTGALATQLASSSLTGGAGGATALHCNWLHARL